MNIKSPATLLDKQPHLGTWLSIGSPVIAELAADSGFDWLLFDLEHGCGSEAALLPQLQAIRGTDTASIVRVGAPHPDLIARVLDWGAQGIMVPHVNSAAEASNIVQAAHYPPRGRRGYSRTVRAYNYGLRSPEQSPAPVIMAQIESIEGVNHAVEIAQVEGVDVLFVGPADLQHDLTHRAAAAPCDFAECLNHVVAAAMGAGKETGILVRDLADVPHYLGLGFTQIAIESDLSILRKSWQQTLSNFRGKP
jgi:2-dehydro-3-deoxyglucarate aldolase/4-hydroxy-2-oxoheptanedioate aldolase